MLFWKIAGIILLLFTSLLDLGLEQYWKDKRTRKFKYLRRVMISIIIVSAISTAITVIIDENNTSETIEVLNGLKKTADNEVIAAKEREEVDKAQLEDIAKKLSVIQTQLYPFVEMATAKYPQLNSEVALEKLANDIEQANYKILALENNLSETTELAKQPSLTLSARKMDKVDSGYLILLQFTPLENKPLGTVIFTARIIEDSDAKIIHFLPSVDHHPILAEPGYEKIQPDGKQAQVSYNIMGGARPTIKLTLSSKAKVRIEGNYLKRAVVLDVL